MKMLTAIYAGLLSSALASPVAVGMFSMISNMQTPTKSHSQQPTLTPNWLVPRPPNVLQPPSKKPSPSAANTPTTLPTATKSSTTSGAKTPRQAAPNALTTKARRALASNGAPIGPGREARITSRAMYTPAVFSTRGTLLPRLRLCLRK
jgi:hypothetical protein